MSVINCIDKIKFKLSPILHSFYDSKIFCKSIQNNINNSTIIGSSIYFYTYDGDNTENDNVYSYEKAYIMCKYLLLQLNYLYDSGYAFTHLELNDILYINKKSFIISNFTNICKIDDSGNINIKYPIIKSKFSSPSILSIDTIPCNISCTSFYHSLALIVLYKMDLSIDNLYLIYNTQLYWILKKWIENKYKFGVPSIIPNTSLVR